MRRSYLATFSIVVVVYCSWPTASGRKLDFDWELIPDLSNRGLQDTVERLSGRLAAATRGFAIRNLLRAWMKRSGRFTNYTVIVEIGQPRNLVTHIDAMPEVKTYENVRSCCIYASRTRDKVIVSQFFCRPFTPWLPVATDEALGVAGFYLRTVERLSPSVRYKNILVSSARKKLAGNGTLYDMTIIARMCDSTDVTSKCFENLFLHDRIFECTFVVWKDGRTSEIGQDDCVQTV